MAPDPSFLATGIALGKKLEELDETEPDDPFWEEASPDLHRHDCLDSIHATDTTKVSEYLLHAKRKARLRQMRLRIPMVLGVTVMIIVAGLLQYFSSEPAAFACLICVFALAPWGSLALLPSDQRAVPLFVTIVVIPAYIAYFWVHIDIVIQRSGMSCTGTHIRLRTSDVVPCWHTAVNLGLQASKLVPVLAFSSKIILALIRRMPSPYLLLLMWSSASAILVNHGATTMMAGISEFAIGNSIWGWTYCSASLCLLVNGLVMMFSSSFRSRVQSWFMSRGEAALSAAGVAQLLGGRDVEDVLAVARSSFSFVRADRVYIADMMDNIPNPRLAVHTERGRIGFVDCFVSHSWHDDPIEKWSCLQGFRAEFKQKHQREPKLWIDKYCINQQNIDESLAALPVYLAGCQQLLILCGKTYLCRLWCLVEMLVFLEIGGDRSSLDVRIFEEPTQGIGGPRLTVSSGCSEAGILRLLRDFDPRKARCFSDHDTERLHSVIDTMGYEGISRLVSDVFCKRILKQEPTQDYHQQPQP